MDVFEFRRHVAGEYEQFTRSFTRIKADDVRKFVDAQYVGGKYCPELWSKSTPTSARAGPWTTSWLRVNSVPRAPTSSDWRKALRRPVYRSPSTNQAEAISLAAARESYVLTTGTGSGKSLSYFIPIVDASQSKVSRGQVTSSARHRHLSDARADGEWRIKPGQRTRVAA